MSRGVTLAICTWVTVLLIFIGYTVAVSTNRTIDDEFGDSVTGRKPIFLPLTLGIWEDENCPSCQVQPDKAITFNGTWHAATFRPGTSGPISIDLVFKGLSVSFYPLAPESPPTGTAIYVYLITGNQIANMGNSYVTLTECNFTLNGQHVGFFRHEPDESTEINYNVLGFSRVNLPNVDHTLRLAVGGVDYYVYVNFDYAIYTFDDGSPNSIPTTTPNPFPIPFPTPTIATNLSSLGTPTSVEISMITSLSKTSETLIPPMASSITTGNLPSNPQTSPPASTITSTPKNGRKTPLGGIVAGAVVGLALIIFVLRFQRY